MKGQQANIQNQGPVQKSPRPQLSLRKEVDQQPNKDRKGKGGGKPRNKDICRFGMDSVEGVDIFQSECLAV